MSLRPFVFDLQAFTVFAFYFRNSSLKASPLLTHWSRIYIYVLSLYLLLLLLLSCEINPVEIFIWPIKFERHVYTHRSFHCCVAGKKPLSIIATYSLKYYYYVLLNVSFEYSLKSKAFASFISSFTKQQLLTRPDPSRPPLYIYK